MFNLQKQLTLIKKNAIIIMLATFKINHSIFFGCSGVQKTLFYGFDRYQNFTNIVSSV